MNVAYDLFSMIMIVIMCNYLIVWDNHHYITSLLQYTSLLMGWHRISRLFSLKTHSINLPTSSTNSLFFGDNTTTYGLHPLSNYGSKLWNSLPNATRSLLTVAAFKLAIRDLELLILTAVPFVNSCKFILLYQISHCIHFMYYVFFYSIFTSFFYLFSRRYQHL